MTLTDKLTQFMATMEMNGYVISRMNNNDILLQYYLSIGVDSDTTLRQFMIRVDAGKLPAYESVTRAIRKSRELTPRWRKAAKQKAKEVEDARTDIGYSRRDL